MQQPWIHRKSHPLGPIALTLALFLADPPPAGAHQEIEVLIADLDRRIVEEPSDPALYLRRGELRRLHCEWTLALKDYQRAREIDRGLAVVDLCLAKILLEERLWTPALLVLDRYLAERPVDAEGLASRARARFRLGDPEGAAQDLVRAIEVYPEKRLPPPELYLEAARALAAAGRPDEALRVLDDGLARLGNPIALALSALQLELDRKRYPQALARLEEAARGSPRNRVWLLRRGRILEEAGRTGEALAAYREALAEAQKSRSSRRNNRATQRLEEEAREAIGRLSRNEKSNRRDQ